VEAVGSSSSDDDIEGFAIEPLESHVRYEDAFVGFEGVDVQWSHHGRNALGEAKHELAFLAEPLEELTLVSAADGGDLEALEGDGSVERDVICTIHDGEAAFCDHGLDVERATNDAADDIKYVLGHVFPSAYRTAPLARSGNALDSGEKRRQRGATIPFV